MIAEAIDTMLTLGWALAAWIAVLAAVGTIVVLAAAATGAWAWRAAWRALTGARSAAQPAKAPIPQPNPERPTRRRPAPTWAHEPHDYEDAA